MRSTVALTCLLILSTVGLASGDDEIQPTPMASIPAGDCIRCPGCSKEDQTPLKLHAYRIDRDEVNMEQYMVCVKAKKCGKPKLSKRALAQDDNYPVRQIKWKDADAYCRFVGKRLPTVAEWERAAWPPGPHQTGEPPIRKDPCIELNVRGYRGRRDYCRWPKDKRILGSVVLDHGTREIQRDEDGNEIDDGVRDVVHTSTGTDDQPIYNMYGNVAEWTSDWDALPSQPGSYYKPLTTTDPQGALTGEWRVVCGGSFASDDGSQAGECTGKVPDKPRVDVGFRCAADALPAPVKAAK